MLHPYYKNPRIGDVGAIAESLQKNGQFRPILVNIGTKTKRKNEVLAGNHTLMAARHIGMTHLTANFINVSEERARAIVLADNETARKGSYDAKVLDELLREVEDLSATGFTELERDAINKEVERMMKDSEKETELMMEKIEQERTAEERRVEREARLKRIADERAAREKAREEAAEDDDEEEVDEDYEHELAEQDKHSDIRDVPDQFDGVDALKAPDACVFPLVSDWGIPELLEEAIPEWDDIPKNLRTWAGSATRDVDQSDVTWFYNWGIDSTSGMVDKSKMICAFYCFDQYFDKWWTFPDRYCTQLLNMGVTTMVGPDWSMGLLDNSRADAIYQLYRQRWISRYAQEAGLMVIPNITWMDGDPEFLENHVLPTLPARVPTIAIQLQTLDAKHVGGGVGMYLECIAKAFDTIQPDGAIIYAGKQTTKMIEDGTLPIPCEYILLPARQDALGKREKAKTKAGTV